MWQYLQGWSDRFKKSIETAFKVRTTVMIAKLRKAGNYKLQTTYEEDFNSTLMKRVDQIPAMSAQ
jgi:hypothetical protein